MALGGPVTLKPLGVRRKSGGSLERVRKEEFIRPELDNIRLYELYNTYVCALFAPTALFSGSGNLTVSF